MEAEGATPPLPDRFKKKLITFKEKLERYLVEPDTESIHDMRTSMRRLELAYKVLPDASRTRASNRYVQTAKQFFRLNGLARDCDVIAEKLEQHGSIANDVLMAILKRRRAKQLAAAMALGKVLNELPLPSLANSESSFAGLLEESVHKRALRFLASLPLVLANENNTEEVHELRKDAKKLFYLLELDAELASLRQMINIKQVQRLAGEIHDSDICTDFLRENLRADDADFSAPIEELLQQEQAIRHFSYQELSNLLNDDHWQEWESLGRKR